MLLQSEFLREEYEALENRLGEVEAAAIELKSEVAEEAHTAQNKPRRFVNMSNGLFMARVKPMTPH
ncbi:hypothetical protein GQ600_19369 [Phytophthora cactorum]|nr:hypothetical protein GQ600_19369 [Phytophthora cactorum]